MIFLQILLSSLIGFLPAPTEGKLPHALYLAVVQIDHSNADADAQVLIKVFANDLQDVIRATYPDAFKQTKVLSFCKENKTSIEAYFQSMLDCQVNGQAATLIFLDGTKEHDVFWLKFNLKAKEEWKEVSIRASFFMEIFSTQSNIIQMIHGSEKRFARLTKKEQSAHFNFQ